MVKNKTELLTRTIVVAVTAAAAAFASYLLFRTDETHITTTEPKKNTSVLVCQTKAMDGGFFSTRNTYNVEQKIKIIFTESMPDKLNYLYNGTYVSTEAASKANDVLHADYNIYMGIDAEKLTPNFSIVNNTLVINLFASRDQMDVKVGKLFFLTDNETENFFEHKDEDLKELYQGKGFSCELEIKQ